MRHPRCRQNDDTKINTTKTRKNGPVAPVQEIQGFGAYGLPSEPAKINQMAHVGLRQAPHVSRTPPRPPKCLPKATIMTPTCGQMVLQGFPNDPKSVNSMKVGKSQDSHASPVESVKEVGITQTTSFGHPNEWGGYSTVD